MRKRKERKWTAAVSRIALAALISAWAVQAPAQTTTGSIYGTVADQSGSVIPNAAVTVTNTQTGEAHIASSNASGNYVFPALVPGDYTVSAKAAGFRSESQGGVRLDANQNAHVSFTLHPGSASQTVTVTAATTLVDTRESQLGETVDQKRIVDLPLNGRDAYDLVQIVPGVTAYNAPPPNGNQVGARFSVNGNRANEDSFYLDGAFDLSVYGTGGNALPNPDALQEFRMLTSNFDAEYGRSPGGVVNAITRSGTNAFHGLLYDYLRNNDLNAKNYFISSVTPLKQNQFGGNIGGPIVRNKTFFFASYQGLRTVTPDIIPSTALTTPTAAEAKGDFSALNSKFWPKQANGTFYSCNGVQGVICPSLLDPVAQNLLTFVPLANPSTGLTPEQSGSANTSANQVMARVDHQLNSRHQLSAMFFASHGTSNNPGQSANQIVSFSGLTAYSNQTNAVLSDAWVVSPNKLNDLRFFYTLNHFNGGNTYNGHTWADLGSQVAEGSSRVNGPVTQPKIIITGYWTMGMGSGSVDNLYQQAIGVVDTFNWTRGNHTIKLGGSFVWNPYAETGAYLGSAQANFTGFATKNALADFLLGRANSFRQNSGTFHRLHVSDPALFAQDDWRVTQKLTLDLGLRWEVFAPFVGQANFGTFSPNTQSKRFPTAPLGLLSVGDPGVPDGIMPTQWRDFTPRVGFAYDLFGNGSTAIRGGYGIFYSTRGVTQITNMEQQPFLRDITVSATPNLINPYAPGPNPFPFVLNLQNPDFVSGTTVSGLPPGAGYPYVQEYNLTVEQQLSPNWGARIAYVGSVGRKWYIARDENSPVYIPGASTSTVGLNARRPYQPTPSTYVFGEISLNDPVGNSSYNSLQATLTRRFAHSFSLLASYVWSKSIDITSQDPSNVTLQLVNENNPGMDRGPSDYDVPQRFVASYLWSTPELRYWGAFGRQVLSGWQLNGITTLATGAPFTVTSGVDTNLDGNDNDRPNVVGNPVLPRTRSRTARIAEFFNTAAFAQLPPATPYGTARRNMLFGPGTFNTDFSAFKDFPVWRESTMQLRGEIFNLFNNVNLNNPVAIMTSPKYGQIGGAGAPRIVQFALRYTF